MTERTGEYVAAHLHLRDMLDKDSRWMIGLNERDRRDVLKRAEVVLRYTRAVARGLLMDGAEITADGVCMSAVVRADDAQLRTMEGYYQRLARPAEAGQTPSPEGRVNAIFVGSERYAGDLLRVIEDCTTRALHGGRSVDELDEAERTIAEAEHDGIRHTVRLAS